MDDLHRGAEWSPALPAGSWLTGSAAPAAAGPLLSVIIPVFNEGPTAGELLRRVKAVPIDKQVIVVDDGSTDVTPAVLDEWSARGDVLVIRHPRNCGKGRAIRSGLRHARGRFTIIQDADLEYDPNDYARVLRPLCENRADVVFGSRYLAAGGRRGGWLFRSGVYGLNCVVRALYGARLTDEATCYKAFPTTVLNAMDLACERFEFCPEVTAKACRLGLRICEVPISYDPRTFRGGKKIRLRDGVDALQALWRWRNWCGSCEPPAGVYPGVGLLAESPVPDGIT